jgi:RNA polymerase sigma factor (TIGR02999 family)
VTARSSQPETIEATGTSPGTVTRLLGDFERGESAALEALFPIVYDELRRLAHRQRSKWTGDTTLDTTALVHELYLKLTAAEHVGAKTRVHFLRIASRAMRHILTNYARERRAEKRGQASTHVPLHLIGEGAALPPMSEEQSETLAELDDALRRLELVDKRLSDVVECRFFGGLTNDETASALGVSTATVKRDWSLARAWLYREMSSEPGN